MSAQYLLCEDSPQVPPYDAAGMSQGLLKALAAFLFPLLQALDERMDKRLVRTLARVRGRHHRLPRPRQWLGALRMRRLSALKRPRPRRHQATGKLTATAQVESPGDQGLALRTSRCPSGHLASGRAGGTGASSMRVRGKNRKAKRAKGGCRRSFRASASGSPTPSRATSARHAVPSWCLACIGSPSCW